jgi:hypothetical protein
MQVANFDKFQPLDCINNIMFFWGKYVCLLFNVGVTGVGQYSGNALDCYSGCAWFECR